MRPDFIARDEFRKYLKPQRINKIMSVDNILASSYINRCERDGKPLKSIRGMYRPIDLYARAKAQGLEILPPKEKTSATLYPVVKFDEKPRTPSHFIKADQASERLTKRRLLEHDEVVDAAIRITPICGVYFLVKDNRVIYVGQSVNVHYRIAQHAESKPYDAVAWIPCEKDELDLLESLYIHAFRPPLNGHKENKMARISLDKLLQMAV